MNRSEIIREASIWLQTARIDLYGVDHKLTPGEDLYIRKQAFHHLLKHYDGKVNDRDFTEIKADLSFILFSKNENRRLEHGI